MRKYGLIGYPLSHSFSQKYFEEKFVRQQIKDCSYALYPLPNIEDIFLLLRSNPEIAGLNVTIPYKESVIQYLDHMDEEAWGIGAVNCIVIDNTRLIGFNTDAYGFSVSLNNFINTGAKKFNGRAFVLGGGGSSKAVTHILRQLEIDFLQVSRKSGNGKISYYEIGDNLKDSNLFINTTPLGMSPDIESCPDIPFNKLSANDFLFDLVYNPAETLFLKKGKQQGAKTKNGLEMLQLQADKSWEIWNAVSA
ncbi:MAG: Shikimate dehydrogenase substrate binding domain protein [Bacteroidota bacterium]|nr:Shikimate dehydrogenase substrate binding domain protein [Bacteroidota bacterium]